jgi:uncharacterized protein YegP (UPF0339 family)
MGKFKLDQTGSQWHFNLLAGNNEVILTSQMYGSKAGAENGIESVRDNAQRNGSLQIKEAKSGQDYFVLSAANGQVIGTSQMYTSLQACENGMASVVRNAPNAELIDA